MLQGTTTSTESSTAPTGDRSTVNAARRFRIAPYYADHWSFDRLDGHSTGGVEIWRVLNVCDDKESAEVRLAVAEGRMTVAEREKWMKARKIARRAEAKGA